QDRDIVLKRRQLMQHKMGDAEQMLLWALAMGRSVAAVSAHRAPNQHVHRHPVSVLRPRVGGDVEEVVEGEGDEVAEHDLNDRMGATKRQAGGDAYNSA